ncbi:MAG: shikimate dehydrogenase, partial [Firmicutes bacterium]|nr:shikimate dehydrogenase [Bacillota bacterium]
MKKSFGLLGEKLGHSFSPQIHRQLGEYDYVLYEVSPDSLDSFMTERRFDGINVTIPYKQAVMPYCATLSNEARMIGSVNTIVKDDDGALHGYNTDYHGFRVMLEQGGINPNGKKVLVLGDGGSARTVRAVLGALGAREIVTISRRGENHYGNIEKHYDAEIIVNTTPVGMFPDNGLSPLNLAGFERLTGVADLIYNPTRTKLLLDAGRLGVSCVNGLTMLVAQAE